MYCERHKIGITYDGDEVSRTDCPFCMLESKHGVIFKKSIVEREMIEKKIQRLLNDVAFELRKHENDNATMLLDRIERMSGNRYVAPPRIKQSELKIELRKVLENLSKEYEEMNGFSRHTLKRFTNLYGLIEQHLGTDYLKEPESYEVTVVEDGHTAGCSVHNNPPRGFATSVCECDCGAEVVKQSEESKTLEDDVPWLKDEAEPVVTDYLEEFRDALFQQLISDHQRWGNTWLNRPKEGQELRTKARYTDYFDMFERAGTPVPWLKIVGGALICWVREQHPELCQQEGTAKEECDFVPSTGKGKLSPIANIPTIIDGEVPVEEATVKELIENSTRAKTVKSITEISATPLGELTPEESAILKSWLCQSIEDEKTGVRTAGFIYAPYIPSFIEDEKTGVRTAHVYNEKLTDYTRGILTAPFKNTGRIKLETVKFTCHSDTHPDIPLSTCAADGFLIPASRQIGIIGKVFANGQYQFRAMQGVGVEDIILADYDYEYDLAVDDREWS